MASSRSLQYLESTAAICPCCSGPAGSLPRGLQVAHGYLVAGSRLVNSLIAASLRSAVSVSILPFLNNR